MPNIATVLRNELIRVAKKEVRRETATLRKATTLLRSDSAALKRRVAELERKVARLLARPPTSASENESGSAKGSSKFRFSPKGLRAHRKRLGLSQEDMGLLFGVSAMSVYNWEAGAHPHPKRMVAIAALKQLGKAEARAIVDKRKLPAPKKR
jgi:DNA-binding XRE family transcriptional regulator